MDVVERHLLHIKEHEPAGGVRWSARDMRCRDWAAHYKLETWIEVQ